MFNETREEKAGRGELRRKKEEREKKRDREINNSRWEDKKCGRQNTLLLKKEKKPRREETSIYDMGRKRMQPTDQPASQQRQQQHPSTATDTPSIHPTDRPTVHPGGEGDEFNNEEPTKGNNTTTQPAFYHQVNDNQTNDEYPVSSIQ
ncbi:hypothetical protein TRV_02662 [Trichophyton verrucosum HKI 0517]|uniref:Uncharacterized protein n=1 Tax=Trichophyton verrucosum (strain HKI 0517) TaxID=663202 RepID=D4D6D7_TRIVH|nr:uncharacterized protein TRV_02662 [Trichophyton verrucosum HKI 0517]EFE42581.1 hypothetical protein TRV_02662 [Trichophyton verrucosum HKI 0517]